MLLPFPTFQWLSISEQSLYYFLSKSLGIWRYCSIERGKMQIKNEGLRGIVSVKFSSVIHLTVDNYYLRGFGFISISV